MVPPELISYAITALGTAAAFVVGILTVGTARRTVKATEKRDAYARDDTLLTHYRGSWESEVEARRKEREDRERLEAKVDAYRVEQDATSAEVERLRVELERVKGWLDKLAAYIRDLLTWAAGVRHPTPHPRIPDDIAHLINDKTQGGTI